jgi:hypothetical protein
VTRGSCAFKRLGRKQGPFATTIATTTKIPTRRVREERNFSEEIFHGRLVKVHRGE